MTPDESYLKILLKKEAKRSKKKQKEAKRSKKKQKEAKSSSKKNKNSSISLVQLVYM
jgi:hypothetical protein